VFIFSNHFARIIGAARLRQSCQQRANQDAGNPPNGAALPGSRHGETRTSGVKEGCTTPEEAPGRGSSSSMSKSAKTKRWPRQAEYLLCAQDIVGQSAGDRAGGTFEDLAGTV